jgi:hypothetical protein
VLTDCLTGSLFNGAAIRQNGFENKLQISFREAGMGEGGGMHTFQNYA